MTGVLSYDFCSFRIRQRFLCEFYNIYHFVRPYDRLYDLASSHRLQKQETQTLVALVNHPIHMVDP